MVNLLPTIRLAQSILKHKFPSVNKPIRIQASQKISPSKRAFEKYKARGLFSEFYSVAKVACRKQKQQQQLNETNLQKRKNTLYFFL